MEEVNEEVLVHLEQGVNSLAERVPRPKLVRIRSHQVFRYVEKSIHQAIVQKLVRMVSTLDAARLLLSNGFLQEQASLQRVLDEIQSDVMFLALGVLKGDHDSELHRRFLDAFFEEEFDADTPEASTQRRPMIPRKKINAYVARVGFSSDDPFSGAELLRTVGKAYSGYVHAASPHIMEMYGGAPRRFHMRGLKRSSVFVDQRRDLSHYFLRGLMAIALCAMASNNEELFLVFRDRADRYRQRSRELGFS